MRVLVACEYSGRVRDAFIRKGHNAISCDFEPSDSDFGPHWQCDALKAIHSWHWDLLIAHPPCTYLKNAGARWFYHPDDRLLPAADRRPHPEYPDRWQQRDEAIEFFKALQNAPIEKKCIENSLMSKYGTDRLGQFTQRVQPWQFGENYTKGACLWLTNLPPLVATHTLDDYSEPPVAACHSESPGADRWKRRSVTYQSIANAMATQWG